MTRDDDPFTNKPFGYEVMNDIAVIRGTPPAAVKVDPTFNRVNEVQLRKSHG